MVVLRATNYVVLEEGIYEACLSRVEEETGEYGIYLKWTFDIRGEEVSGLTSSRTGQKAKARAWIEAILGRALADGEDINTDHLYGIAARVYVTVVQLPDGGECNRVEKVLKKA